MHSMLILISVSCSFVVLRNVLLMFIINDEYMNHDVVCCFSRSSDGFSKERLRRQSRPHRYNFSGSAIDKQKVYINKSPVLFQMTEFGQSYNWNEIKSMNYIFSFLFWQRNQKEKGKRSKGVK